MSRCPGLLALGVLLSAIFLSGCGTRPSSATLEPVAATVEGSKPVSIVVATTRERSETTPETFTDGRARQVNYEQYGISIPPHHVSGSIEWPSKTPGNPETDFVVTSARPLEGSEFEQALTASIRAGGDGNVVVFVHGYNTNYQEAVFRMAQLTAVNDYKAQPVLFAWPSRGELTGYVADRESTTYSRDYLEQTLNRIARIPSVRGIWVVAHSMGNWLAVETIRQAKIRGTSPFLAKLDQVALLSPDVDLDVFRSELDAIGRLRNPIIIALSKDDKALAASQTIAGDVPRVGNVLIDNPREQAAIERYNLKVVDLSQLKGGDSLGHSKFIQVIPQLRNVALNSTGDHPGVAAPGVFVANAAGRLATAPIRIGNALIGN